MTCTTLTDTDIHCEMSTGSSSVYASSNMHLCSEKLCLFIETCFSALAEFSLIPSLFVFCALIRSSVFCPSCLFLSQLYPPDSSAPSRFLLTPLLVLMSEILQVQLCDCISSCTMVNTTVYPMKVVSPTCVCACVCACL